MSIAVLLMAYGAAAGPEDVPAYLADIRAGRPPDDGLVAEVRERYRLMGGKSPLIEITQAQGRALESRLAREGAQGAYRVHVGMRHSPPWIREAVARIRQEGHETVVALPLTPFHSPMTVGAYLAKLEEAKSQEGASFRVAPAGTWHREVRLVSAWARRVREAIDRLSPPRRDGAVVLFTGHSLPERVLREVDLYPAQLRETAGLVAAEAGLSAWEFAFQSQGRTPEPWLGPEAGSAIRALAARGVPAVVIAPVGFVSDHMETLYDVDILYRGLAEGLGLGFARAESLNADPELIEVLAGVAMSAGAS